MSTIKSKNLQIGTDGTASNNFTIYQPGTPDGTLRVGNGNAGSVTDAVTINSSGAVTLANNLTVTGTVTQTGGATFNGGISGDVNFDSGTLYVDATNNRVGIGTSSPSYTLDISSSVDPVIRVNCSGTGPNTGLSITKEQGSGDLANWNAININGNDNVSYESRIQWTFDSIANGPAIGGKRTGSGETDLIFHTNASETLNERMRINSAGTIIIQPASSNHTTTADTSGFEGDGGYASTYFCRASFTSTKYMARFYNPNGKVGQITTSGTSTAYTTSSDYRLKENNVNITDGISRVKLLKPYRFNFIADADTTVDGFFAHEVQDVVPEAIHGTKDAVDDEGNPDYQAIDQSKLVPLLTAALQEAITKIEDLETRIQALESNP